MGGEGTHQGLLVFRHQRRNTFRRCGHRRVVDLFGTGESVAYRLQTWAKIRAFHTTSESGAVAEQKGFEFMQHYMWHESAGVESAAYVSGDIVRESSFDRFRIPRKRKRSGGCPARPSSRPALRQPVVVDHRGGDGLAVRPQVAHDLLAYRLPGLDPAPLTALSSIADQACADLRGCGPRTSLMNVSSVSPST